MEKIVSDFILDEDVRLMLKFKEGDKSAFEQIFDKYHIHIINFIYRMIGEKAESENLAQEVFLRVYRSGQNYRPKAKFSVWIYMIAKNLALNELRKKKSHKTSSLDEIVSYEEGELPRQVPEHNKPSALIELERHELIDAVRKAINSLPDKQRIAVILRRYEDFSYEEIAKIMGCSISAVKSLLNRAKEALKEKLSPYVENT